jgi:thymidine kinase
MLKVFGGPMFAGKTTSLLEEAAKLPAESFLFFKPAIDVRYDKDAVVSHDGKKIDALIISNEKPVFPKIDKKKIRTIFIDELNFFDFATLESAVEKLLKQGFAVIGAGLLYDSARQPFGATLPLSKKADQFVELFAYCDVCKKPAEHTYRKVRNSQQVLVGAKESYGACCAACWVGLQV